MSKTKHTRTASTSKKDGQPVIPARTRPILSKDRLRLLILFLLISVGGSIAYLYLMSDPNLKDYQYKVIRKYAHDTKAFTQGLVYEKGFLYESTGKLGESSIRKIRLSDETTLISKPLDANLFAEGLVLWDGQFIQLTYKNQIAIVYDKSLDEVERKSVDGDGWGITHDGTHLIMSNGTSRIRYLDPDTMEVVRTLPVSQNGMRLADLNELEYVNGKIYANVWKTDYIVEIDPETGRVTGRLNLKDLYPANQRKDSESVLNGIAYNSDTGNLIVTGKNWPFLYEIELSVND